MNDLDMVEGAALPDLHTHVRQAAQAGELVVQPRMGMALPAHMQAGLRAVAGASVTAVATITLDSYTRVGDHAGARSALDQGRDLNGFPLVVHGARTTAEMVRQACVQAPVPVQVRHGSAAPQQIFQVALRAGLAASEGGPVSYCLPYGRTPLAESVGHWDAATVELAEGARARGLRAHLETFGGCMLGQLCPPSLLVALSVLEALFFAQRGIPTVSLSLAQQTDPQQDVEALAALRILAAELLPPTVAWHIVLYTYMGVYPRTPDGAGRLLDASAELAVRGGAERLIVKTPAESHRIPTVPENIAALRRAAHAAAHTSPSTLQVDCSEVLAEARALVAAVLDTGDDVGKALIRAFSGGVLDVPFCLHRDNLGLTRSRIGADGRLEWERTGQMPIPGPRRPGRSLGARGLLTMLRHTADAYDALALKTAEPAGPSARWAQERPPGEPQLCERAPQPTRTQPPSPQPLLDDRPKGGSPRRIAVIGSGPRGIAVLERLAARCAATPPEHPVEIHVFDTVQVGSGRIWRTDQPSWFLMNTVAGEVTMFSGPRDSGPDRPGAGPRLDQWWQDHDPACPGPGGYAPRARYGQYLQYVMESIERNLPPAVTLQRRRAEVVDLTPCASGYHLITADGTTTFADRVVLTTGHPQTRLEPVQQDFADFAEQRPHLLYIRGDSASDMPLHLLRPGSRVGVIGLGLSFYDVMVALTTGRGGHFEPAPDGTLRYVPSGDEPLLVAGSRSGMPFPARGRNQKPGDHTYRPRVFTTRRIQELRSRGRLDFRADVLPLLLAEMEAVYYATEVRRRYGPDVGERFLRQATDHWTGRGTSPKREDLRTGPNEQPSVTLPDTGLRRLAEHYGLTELSPLDIQALTRPFADRTYPDPERFQTELLALIDTDLTQAELGNAEGPLKAACDVLRDTRGVLRAAVDFCGLTPRSHRDDFLAWFTPLSSFLAAGPPLVRLQQTKALLQSGVLRVAGPSVNFAAEPEASRFIASSPQVGGDPITLDALVDARIPAPNLSKDLSQLTRSLHASGLWTNQVNAHGDDTFDTGGVAVTATPFHPIRRDGRPETGLYVLGIPTEHTRWFTQVGSGKRGDWTEFTRDADTIAAHILDKIMPARSLASAQKAGELL